VTKAFNYSVKKHGDRQCLGTRYGTLLHSTILFPSPVHGRYLWALHRTRYRKRIRHFQNSSDPDSETQNGLFFEKYMKGSRISYYF